MNDEVNINGVFFPALILWAAVAALVSPVVRRILDAAGVYRFVWHRGLFNIAVFVIVWGVLTWLTARRL
jgi:protein AaeX